MANGTDVQLELSDHELGLSDHSLHTASVGLHSLRIFPASTLQTLRRKSNVPHLLQALVTIGWPAAYFGQITHFVQSVRECGVTLPRALRVEPEATSIPLMHCY